MTDLNIFSNFKLTGVDLARPSPIPNGTGGKSARKLRRFAKRRAAITTPAETPLPRVAKSGLLSGLTGDELAQVIRDARERALSEGEATSGT